MFGNVSEVTIAQNLTFALLIIGGAFLFTLILFKLHER